MSSQASALPGSSGCGRLGPARLRSSGMQTKRLSREQFFGKLATLDDDHLRKALWNLYWRGSAMMRERIEAELDPVRHDRRRSSTSASVDPEEALAAVGDF